MPKRRRSSAPGTDEDGTKKRKRSAQYDPTEFCQELYDNIRNYKNDEGRILCETFIRVPKRRTAAEYYDVISQPIDLMRIHHKLKNDEYEEVEEMGADMELLLNNAKMYYKRNTQEFSDATELWNHYQVTKTDLLNRAYGDVSSEQDAKSTTPDDDEEEDDEDDETLSSLADQEKGDPETFYEELFASVVTAKDGDREMSQPFQLLPSKLAYADYYQTIKKPIDLKMIATKIKNEEYGHLDELEKDLLLMTKNARAFNAPNSLIYKDAGALKKIIVSRKNEMETLLASQSKSRKLRVKRQFTNLKLSQVYANLEYPPDDQQERAPDAEDEDEDDNDDGRSAVNGGLEEERLIDADEDDSGAESSIADGEDNVLWTLFKSIMNLKPQGQSLIEPFMRLPSRRHYPDYYDEIDRPVSMMNIKKKLKRHQYDSLEDLCEDLDQMFENAQQYNTDESKIFKDAIRLQKFMKTEKKKLESGIRNEMDEDDYGATPKTSRKIRRTTPTPSSGEKGRPGPKKAVGPEEVLRKRLWMLYKTVHDHEDDGRPLVLIFMELPSKKDYPDYYQVISEPIDMAMIERKIVEDRYAGDQDLISDFELMFNNARHYNEENSQVYKDAETLEKILKRKWKTLSPLGGGNVSRRSSLTSRQKAGMSGGLIQRLTDLYNCIKDYNDSRGRVLSTPFMRLPTKTEYPNYYEVIKKPIDMLRINQRLTCSQYESLDDMVNDFVLLFDNACRYNEPDSLIYKDALALQRVCLEKKAELSDDDSGSPPDVRAIVQEMMMNLFITVYNHQDEEGRCYSDSFVEFLHQTEIRERASPGTQPRLLSFDQIKRNVNKGRYRRMDRFQQDMSEVFASARRCSRTDSQVFEDSVELQLHFIEKRDEYCKNGEILLSPALSYTQKHLQHDVEEIKKIKLPMETKEDEEKKRQQSEQDARHEKLAQTVGTNTFTHKGEVYNVGDFVYLEPRDKNLESHIVCIEKMYYDGQGEAQVYGLWMYRPAETYHVPTRKFLEKEVFRSDFSDDFPLGKVLGKCFVLWVKDYFKNKPEGFEDKDVYVCESRYSTRHKIFKKIKIWQTPKNETKMVVRPLILPVIRVASVFADKSVNKDDENSREDDGQPVILDKARETVMIESGPTNADESHHYYEQLITGEESYKLGDSVYVRSAQGRPFIARIDKLWSDANGNVFFHGPWFMTPVDVEHSPTRLFYRKEVFRSMIESTTPLLAVMGKCVVLALRDYLMCRPYEYSEDNIYLCESKYTDQDRTIRKLPKGLKKFQLSPRVLDDELFFFRKPLCPKKEPSPLLMKMQLEQTYRDYDESSNDAASLSQTFEEPNFNQFGMDMDMSPCPAPPDSMSGTPQQKKPGPKPKQKLTASATSSPASGGTPRSAPKKKSHPSGYIIFAGECRRAIQEENPDMSFGEISKIVGTRWRNLGKSDKERFEERAKEKAEENERKEGEAARVLDENLAAAAAMQAQQQLAGQPPQPGQMHAGYPPHHQMPYLHPYHPGPGMMMAPPPGMLGAPGLTQMAPPPPPGMSPQRPGMMPLQPYPGVPPSFAQGPSSQGLPPPPPQQMAPPAPPPRPPSPIFISVPARTQRLVHSEAYLKYIENLGHEGSRRTPAWERDLSANQQNTQIHNPAKLPVHWLGGVAPENQQEAITALWNLRDLMLKDALAVSRVVECT